MSSWTETRHTVSRLLNVGETAATIVRILGCSRALIYKVKKFKEKKGGDLKRAEPPPRNKWIMTPRVQTAITRKIQADPNKSISVIGDELGINRKNVSRYVKKIGGKLLRRIKVPLISAEGRERRAIRAAGLLNDLKSTGAGRIIFFSDKKKLRRGPNTQYPKQLIY